MTKRLVTIFYCYLTLSVIVCFAVLFNCNAVMTAVFLPLYLFAYPALAPIAMVYMVCLLATPPIMVLGVPVWNIIAFDNHTKRKEESRFRRIRQGECIREVQRAARLIRCRDAAAGTLLKLVAVSSVVLIFICIPLWFSKQ